MLLTHLSADSTGLNQSFDSVSSKPAIALNSLSADSIGLNQSFDSVSPKPAIALNSLSADSIGLHQPLDSVSRKPAIALNSLSADSTGLNQSFDSVSPKPAIALNSLSADSTGLNQPLDSVSYEPILTHSGGLHLSIKSPTTDWSRSSRKRIAILKAGSDPKQLRITSFFERVMETAMEAGCFKHVIEEAQHQGRMQFLNVSGILQDLLRNAERNALKVNTAMRHEEVIKKFATSLFIYCGPMAYNFLHQNLHGALPSTPYNTT